MGSLVKTFSRAALARAPEREEESASSTSGVNGGAATTGTCPAGEPSGGVATPRGFGGRGCGIPEICGSGAPAESGAFSPSPRGRPSGLVGSGASAAGRGAGGASALRTSAPGGTAKDSGAGKPVEGVTSPLSPCSAERRITPKISATNWIAAIRPTIHIAVLNVRPYTGRPMKLSSVITIPKSPSRFV